MDSGLLDVLVPEFEKQTGYRVKVIAVGTGQAPAMADRGEADVLLCHAPAEERKRVDAGVVTDYRLVMHNDFIIVGPPEDPAGIKGKASVAAIQAVSPKLRLQMLALGANRWQYLWLLLREARLGILAAVIAGFGGAVSEVGASAMVGGNVKGYTRVATTATMLEVSKGNFEIATALSIILLLISFGITAALTCLQQRGRQPA